MMMIEIPNKRILCLMAVLFSLALPAFSQDKPPQPLMSFGSEPRDSTQRPDEVLKAMNVQSGQVIADIGAGRGYFTRRFAAAGGPGGKAIGLDIDPAAVRAMMADAKKYGLTNYE